MSLVLHAGDNEATPLLVSVQTLPNASADPPRLLLRRQSAAHMAGMFLWRVGALYGATAVALGAFGAHGLKKHITDPQRLQNWSTAAHYQLAHSVAMLATRGHPVAGTLFTAGMTLFSGSIYALTLDPERFKWMGPVTPLGGLCFILGWLSLIFSRGAVRL